MMPTADFVGIRQKRFILLLPGQLIQDFGSDHGVLLHDLIFLCCQLSRLVQYGLGNVDFPDVVECRRRADHGNVGGAQGILICAALKGLQEQRGCLLNVQNMQAAFAVSEFYNMTENVHHHVRILFIFIDLLGNHL